MNDPVQPDLFFCKRNKCSLEKKECVRRQVRRITYTPCDPTPSYLECRDCKQGKLIMEGPQEEKQMEEKTTKKQCSMCKEFKPLDAFGSNKRAKDGKSWYCKKCNAKRSKESWEKKHGKTNSAKEQGTPKPKPAGKHPDLDSFLAKLESNKALLLAEIDRINTTISVIQERM